MFDTNLPINNPLLTLSTCWYMLKSKFDYITYFKWIQNIVAIVKNFNLVIYTDINSSQLLSSIIPETNKKIKIIIKPLESLHTYIYKNYWIENHKISNLNLHSKIDWELNMLWNEKVFFVNETIKHQYFDSLFYGWCDIGYFRNRKNDIHLSSLVRWPSNEILLSKLFNDYCIHYGCVQNNIFTYIGLLNDIKTHYNKNKSSQPVIKLEEICFSGGFFILKKELIDIYVKLYDDKLKYYFSNKYVIKDDQTIIMDIIFTNQHLFAIHYETSERFDNWFMFQRLLL